MTLLKVLDFTDEILSGPVHIDECDLLDEWHQVLLFHLSSSFKGLQAVRLVSANGLYEPAKVLTRYLFELGINLRYLDMDPKARVPKYLERSNVPSTPENFEVASQKLKALQEEDDYVGISELLLPDRSWTTLRAMCQELNCMEHYSTIYRSASHVAHGGAYSMHLSILEIVGYAPRLDYEMPGILLTAITYFGWVAEIGCKVFPHLESKFKFGSTWGDDMEALEQEVKEAIKQASPAIGGTSA